jgi:hypothetical protein
MAKQIQRTMIFIIRNSALLFWGGGGGGGRWLVLFVGRSFGQSEQIYVLVFHSRNTVVRMWYSFV